MGFINKILGASQLVGSIGEAVKSTSEVFRVNQTEAMKLQSERFQNVQNQYGKEYSYAPTGAFSGFVNGLNRMPRPLLAFGTIGLFVYAMIDPEGFSERMIGLDAVPEPMWWLLGAIVGFYFGARELHYLRGGQPTPISKKNTGASYEPEEPINDVPVNLSTASSVKNVSKVQSENQAVRAWLSSVE